MKRIIFQLVLCLSATLSFFYSYEAEAVILEYPVTTETGGEVSTLLINTQTGEYTITDQDGNVVESNFVSGDITDYTNVGAISNEINAASGSGYQFASPPSQIRSHMSTYSQELANATSEFSLDEFSLSPEHNELRILNPTNGERSFFEIVIKFIGTTVATFAIFAMSVGAYFLVTANGDQNQITKGKSIFTYALIGVAVTFLSYSIIALVISLASA